MKASSVQQATEEVGGKRPWFAFGVLAVTQFMVVLDASIVYVALPSIGRDLSLSSTGLAWVMDAYILAFGGAMMLGGRAGDLLGRRRVLFAGLLWFGLASLACGLAIEAWQLLAARAAQGLGAAFIAPTALALVTDTFPDGPTRFKALGIFGGIGGFGGAAGTLLGGMLTAIGWQWAFLVNIPVVVAVLVAGARLLPSAAAPATGGVDFAGVVTASGGLCLLLLALLRGATGWASWPVVLELAGAVALFAAFGIRQATAAAPLVPRLLFRRPSVVLGNVANILVGSLLFGVFLVLTLHLQVVRGYAPLTAALWTMPISISLLLGSNLVPGLFTRLTPVGALAAALLLQVAGLTWWSLALRADGELLTSFVLPGVVWAFGCGAAIVAAFVVCTSGIEGPAMGAASGLVSTTLQIGAALGVAVLSVLIHGRATAAGPSGPLAALTAGQSTALWAAAVIAVLGIPLLARLRTAQR